MRGVFNRVATTLGNKKMYKKIKRRLSGSPLVQVLGNKQVEEAELQFGTFLLLLQQPGQLVSHAPRHLVLAAHTVKERPDQWTWEKPSGLLFNNYFAVN